MSRYGNHSPRGPQPERWDSDRFARERSGRQVIERDRFEERDRYSGGGGGRRRESSADDFYYSSRAARGGGAERFDEDRYFAEERYGPPARRSGGGGGGNERQRRYYEEEEIDSFESSPARGAGSMVPFEGRKRLSGRGPPPRPGIIRRQSSLDTFDRRPMPKYREAAPRPRTPPEVIAVPAPGRRRRREEPRYEPRYVGRDYDDITVAEPDRFGDENFRGWREREIETTRRRRRSSPNVEDFRERDEFRETDFEIEEVEEEKPWPRRGRTKMTARLVNKRALVQLGYPFEDEIDEKVRYVFYRRLSK